MPRLAARCTLAGTCASAVGAIRCCASSFDLIGAMLGAMAEVTVSSALSRRLRQLAGHVGVVVLSSSTSAAGFGAEEVNRVTASPPATVPVLWLSAGSTGAAAGPAAQVPPVLCPIPVDLVAAFVMRAEAAGANARRLPANSIRPW